MLGSIVKFNIVDFLFNLSSCMLGSLVKFKSYTKSTIVNKVKIINTSYKGKVWGEKNGVSKTILA